VCREARRRVNAEAGGVGEWRVGVSKEFLPVPGQRSWLDPHPLFFFFRGQAVGELSRCAIGQLAAGGGINQGIVGRVRNARIEPIPQARGIGMGGEEDVTGGGAQESETTLEALEKLRAVGEFEGVRGGRRETVRVDDVEAVAGLAGFPGPTGAARSVAWREVGGQFDGSDAEGLQVVKCFHVSDGYDAADDSVLGIVGGHAALFEDGGAPVAGRHSSAAKALQLRHASGVVKVNVGIDDELDIFDAEAQGSDIGDDLRDRFGEAAVDENMTGVGGNENDAQAVRPDVVSVPVNAEWCLRSVPSGAVAAGRVLLGEDGTAAEEQTNQRE